MPIVDDQNIELSEEIKELNEYSQRSKDIEHVQIEIPHSNYDEMVYGNN
jgi:hypothetical protein